MLTNSVIMLQIADREWTLDALHSACLMARRTQSTVVLAQMIPVQNPGLLGTEMGFMNFSHQDQAELDEYKALVERYGVECQTLPFQYVSLVGAIVQVAEYVDAKVVFAMLPDSMLPIWTKFQKWALNRQIAQQGRQWLEQPVHDHTSLIPALEAFPKVKHS